MSTGTPEKLIPRYLDPRKLAHQQAFFDGGVPAAALPRLGSAVASVQGVRAEIQFRVAEQGERVLQGTVVADVAVTCQRCLEPFAQRVISNFKLAAVWSEEEAKQLAAAYDPWVTGEGEGDVYDILEEELLLSLPVVAFHENDCVDRALFSSGELPDGELPGESADKKSNPFQVLKQLKGNIKE